MNDLGNIVFCEVQILQFECLGTGAWADVPPFPKRLCARAVVNVNVAAPYDVIRL